MRFDEMETIVKKMAEIDEIPKENLTMVYQLSVEKHRALDEHLFFKFNPNAKKKDFKHRDTFEIDTGIFTMMFIKEEKELDVK